MTDQPAHPGFQSLLRAALPHDERIQDLLTTLSDETYAELAADLAERLSSLDVVLALPEGVALARQLADRLGLPLVGVRGHSGGRDGDRFQIEASSLRDRPRGLLVSLELSSGVAEMEVAVMAQGLGCEVRTLACVLERSTAQGRHRLLQLGIHTHAAVRIAQIPSGWIIERRQLEARY